MAPLFLGNSSAYRSLTTEETLQKLKVVTQMAVLLNLRAFSGPSNTIIREEWESAFNLKIQLLSQHPHTDKMT